MRCVIMHIRVYTWECSRFTSHFRTIIISIPYYAIVDFVAVYAVLAMLKNSLLILTLTHVLFELVRNLSKYSQVLNTGVTGGKTN